MGAEISAFVAQDDAALSLDGVAGDPWVSQSAPTAAAELAKEAPRSLHRTAADVARREQLFAFCADWDVASVGRFLRCYARVTRQRATGRTSGGGHSVGGAELTGLAALHARADALEQDVREREALLEQLNDEVRAAQVTESSASGVNAHADGGHSCSLPSGLADDLETSRREAQLALRDRLLELRELQQHLLASIEDADLSCVVQWPLFLTAVERVGLQMRSSSGSTQAVAELQHPAAVGYAMQRAIGAAATLTEFSQGDILLPPMANHEIDGFTDDSASSSAASADEVGDGDEEDSDDDDSDDAAVAGGGAADDDDKQDRVRDDGATKFATGDADSKARSERDVATGESDGDDQGGDDSSSDESDGDIDVDSRQTTGAALASAPTESPASEALTATRPLADNADHAQAADATPLTPAAIAMHESTPAMTRAPNTSVFIPFKDLVKRPRVIKRAVPELFDASRRSPVFFGYSLEKERDEVAVLTSEQMALEQREESLFQQKATERKTKLESTLASERGKLQAITQRESDVRSKRERFWQKRAAEFERAKKELDPNDVFFRTHEAQDKRTRDHEASEDDESRRQRMNVEVRMAAAQTQHDEWLAKVGEVRSTEFPLGTARIEFHEAEMELIQGDISEAKGALAVAKDEYVALKTAKVLVVPGQEGKQRAQLLFAEGQIKAKEKDVERVCGVLENELFLLKRAHEIFEREKVFVPFFQCLNGGECMPGTGTSFVLLAATTALLLGVGGSRMDEKVRFLFAMFARKVRERPRSTATVNAMATATVARKAGIADDIAVLPRESFAGVLGVLLRVFAKIGDMHPPHDLSTEYLLGLAEREYLRLEVDRGAAEVTGSGSERSPPRSGMTCLEFEKYCVETVEKSKYLCELLCHPWKYEQLSRFVVQHMSATHQYRLGLINLNDLKFAVARQMLQPREELARSKKNVIHERALAMGENDPLKTDYSKYLPKRRAKLLSNVVPLDHGGYRNLLHYRMEIILRATVKLQTTWRARKGRQIARLAAEKQAFYHARGVALEDARAAVESAWRERDAKAAHTVEKMKFEAKIRMKQVKLRAKGNAFSREQVLALLMEEAVQLAQRDVENRFREMEEELGYLEHAESLELPHAEMGYLKAEISSALVAHVEQARQESALVSKMLETIAKNEEVAKQKAQQKKTKKTGAKEKETGSAGGEEVPESDALSDESEKHLVDSQDRAERDMRSAARTANMVTGRFPAPLYHSGLTRHEYATQMRLSASDPPLAALQQRLKQVCVGMTDFKLAEFLQELPSKRHICDYVSAFRRFDGAYDRARIESDLFEHFRIVRGSEQLAEALVGIAESDLEFGESTKLLRTIQDENTRVLDRLVAAQTATVAAENAAAAAKKLVRMGYKVVSTEARNSNSDPGSNKDAADETTVAVAASPSTLLAQKEQHERTERKKRVHEAHARMLEAMQAWKEAELSLLETERQQLRVSAEYPVLASHHTKWAERFQHALRLPERDAQQLQDKYTEVRSVCQDFLDTATAIALVLVRELFLPLRAKSVLPTSASAVDGRQDDVRATSRLKYEAHDILFKICTDDHGRFEGSHELSAKCGAHEVRNSALYLRALSHEPSVVLPLECCVDFQGFRVLCVSKIPIEVVAFNESGGSVQKVSKQLVHGSDNRGKTITFQSKALDGILADAAVRLNVCRHNVRGYQDLTSKSVHAPADMLGYVNASKHFVLLNFARAMPPEDPEATPHLTQSTRGMSILWRQLRPELVSAFHTPLSPDALSSMTYCTPDWQTQALAVESATRHLVDTVIPSFARKLSKRPHFFTAAHFDLTAEMHRHGINVRHLGLLRSQFQFALSGTATLQYATAEIQTTEDFTREVERGSPVFVGGKACEVSRDPAHRFDATCVTLTLVHTGNSVQNVAVYGGRDDCNEHATAIRAVILAEMIARAFKNVARHMMRVAAKLAGTGVTSFAFKNIVVQLLNMLSGAQAGSEAFWKVHLFEGIRSRFGPRAVSEVDKLNMRRLVLPRLRYIVERSTEMLGATVTQTCLTRLAQHPDCYAFTLDDYATAGDNYRVKHNMSMLHFSVASLLLLQATVTQATSYKQLVLADGPCGYWTLCERRGLSTAANLGKCGIELVGKYLPGCTLEAEGPIVNIDLNRAVQLRKAARSYVAFPYVASLYPVNAASHATLEAWCRCDGHESTRRVVLTIGRFTLSALKANLWAFTLNVKNIDIVACGSRVELLKWTHLVGSFDGTMLRLYVDGYLASEVEVESVVDVEIAKREAVIRKTREDICGLEDEAKGACFKDVDREMQQVFASKDGKKLLKAASQKLLDEHDFRVRLSKSAGAGAPIAATTAASGQAIPTKKDASKVARADFEPLAKKQMLRERFDARWHVRAQEFQEMRRRVNLKIEKELDEQAHQDERELRIGCLSSVRRRDGKHFFHGSIAHVAYYNHHVLTHDQVNAHFVLAVRDRAHTSDYLFSLAASRFSRTLAFAPDDTQTLEKFAENVCASLKYDLDHQHAQEMYKKKVRCGLAPLVTTENVHGIAEIMKSIPRTPCFADLFLHCYTSLMRLQPAYFQATESPQCRLALRELSRMPFAFFLGSRSANSIVNILGDSDDHEREAQEKVTTFADIIRKVLREYPMMYGDQLTIMAWLRDLQNANVIVHFVLALEAGEDARCINLKDVPDVSDDDMEVIVKNNHFCTALELAHCSRLSDVAILRMTLCCTQLEVLDMSHLELVTDVALLAIGKSCHRLRRLRMPHCRQISDIGVEAVVRSNPKLEELALSFCERVSDRCFPTIGKCCPSLATLEVELCMQLSNSAVKHLAAGLAGSNTLKRLNLAGCRRIGDEGLLAVAKSCSRLTELNVRQCDKLTDVSVRAVTHHCLELEVLNLEDVYEASHKVFVFDQEGDGRGVVEKHLARKLKDVDLTGCSGLTDLALGHLCHRAKQLRAITLSSCATITDLALTWMREDMLDKSRCGEWLEHVDVSYCPQLSPHAVCELVVQCPRLTSLNLSGCVHLSDETLVSIVDACNKLVRLEVGFCRELTDVAVCTVAARLSLEELNLARCVKVTDESMLEVASQFTVLRKLNVSACKKLTAKTLEALLEGCRMLEELDVTHCPLFPPRQLAQFLRKKVRVINRKLDDVAVTRAAAELEVEEAWRRESESSEYDERAEGGESGRTVNGDAHRVTTTLGIKSPKQTLSLSSAKTPGSCYVTNNLPPIHKHHGDES